MHRLRELMWQVLAEALLVLVRVLMERLGHWLMDRLREPDDDAAVVSTRPIDGENDESP